MAGAAAAVTTTDVVAANIYDRICTDFANNNLAMADFVYARHNLMYICPTIEDRAPELQKYVTAVKGFTLLYAGHTVDVMGGTNQATIQALELLAQHWGFAGGVMNWYSIAFVIFLAVGAHSSYVRLSIWDGGDNMIIKWCINFLMRVPESCGMSAESFVNNRPNGWEAFYDAELTRQITAIPAPRRDPNRPLNNCTCGLPKMNYVEWQRPYQMCPKCHLSWCTVEECEYIFHEFVNLATHHLKCHRIDRHNDRHRCECGALQSYRRKDFSSNRAPCRHCTRFWCMTDACDKNYSSVGHFNRHQNAKHPHIYLCKNCGAVKSRPPGVEQNQCACGVFHCLIGICRKEFGTQIAVNNHLPNCTQRF